MSKVYRKTHAEINLNHLYSNIVEIQKFIPNKTIIPVVKANAYGHGVLEVVDNDEDISFAVMGESDVTFIMFGFCWLHLFR